MALSLAPAARRRRRPERTLRLLGPAGELAVDDGLEGVERLRARERVAVDEEGRRAGDARVLARLLVRLDGLRLLAGVEALVELRRVELQLARVLLQLGDLELA